MFVAQPQHDVEDHRAQRGVDHRDRLVGDDQLRLEQIGARHHHALALAAAELVRIFFQHLFAAHPHHVERIFDQVTRPRLFWPA
jgi:hypothetical protein